MEFPEVLEGPVDNHFSLVRPWGWYHERLCGHNKNRNKSKWDRHRKTSGHYEHLLNSLAEPTLSLGVCLWTAPITRALITKRWSPVMVRSGCVPDHWLRIWSTDHLDLTPVQPGYGKYTFKIGRGRSQQREKGGGRSKGCALSSGDRGVAQSRFRECRPWKNKTPSMRDVKPITGKTYFAQLSL